MEQVWPMGSPVVYYAGATLKGQLELEQILTMGNTVATLAGWLEMDTSPSLKGVDLCRRCHLGPRRAIPPNSKGNAQGASHVGCTCPWFLVGSHEWWSCLLAMSVSAVREQCRARGRLLTCQC